MKKILLFLMAIFVFGIQNVGAQDGIKIVTNHPDFNIKVKRCAASGKTVIIDLILNNEGTNDVEQVQAWGGFSSEAYDDEGNIYQSTDLKVKVANRQNYNHHESGLFNIPTGVPIKLTYRIEEVPQSAQSISRLKLNIECQAWGIGAREGKFVKISNIPITRK